MSQCQELGQGEFGKSSTCRWLQIRWSGLKLSQKRLGLLSRASLTGWLKQKKKEGMPTSLKSEILSRATRIPCSRSVACNAPRQSQQGDLALQEIHRVQEGLLTPQCSWMPRARVAKHLAGVCQQSGGQFHVSTIQCLLRPMESRLVPKCIAREFSRIERF
jgi:hypothetical protein